ncbi:hypothetical protein ABC383_07885 [Noviherbaspirillum sp. 1P10PC]|uniref:hypothetical protein n=1 Tax=Noviherbaspirillum sp. 1P10PC TaxID=3132292 RepID=UPI0039A1EA69
MFIPLEKEDVANGVERYAFVNPTCIAKVVIDRSTAMTMISFLSSSGTTLYSRLFHNKDEAKELNDMEITVMGIIHDLENKSDT